ncbi:hypothetical protein A4U64_23470 [Rhodococcus sp. WB1]|nr:CGNR zinc finger domain-containing protein [Rhodococcus sp. WB1]ANZ27305.1 hypothetical protein A4U64_23470 [Rhodococcus sp. WB1]
MQFNHDNMTGALLAADLVNLVERSAWTVPEVQAVFREHVIRWSDVDKSDVPALRRWTTRLRAVFVAPDEEQRCRSINALLLDGVASVYLTTHDNHRPHLHFTPDEDDLVGRVMAVTAGGLAIFTVEAEGGRLGACANAGCVRVFVDTSRNGRRAYCSARCGNADAVRRHRARKSH